MRAEELAATRGRDLEASRKECEGLRLRIESLQKEALATYERKIKELMDKCALADKEAMDRANELARVRREATVVMDKLRRENDTVRDELKKHFDMYVEADDERKALQQLRQFNLDAMGSLGKRLESVMAERGEMEHSIKELKHRIAILENEKKEISDKTRQLSLVLGDMTHKYNQLQALHKAGGLAGASDSSTSRGDRSARSSVAGGSESAAPPAAPLSPTTRDLVVAEAVGVSFRAADPSLGRAASGDPSNGRVSPTSLGAAGGAGSVLRRSSIRSEVLEAPSFEEHTTGGIASPGDNSTTGASKTIGSGRGSGASGMSLTGAVAGLGRAVSGGITSATGRPPMGRGQPIVPPTAGSGSVSGHGASSGAPAPAKGGLFSMMGLGGR